MFIAYISPRELALLNRTDKGVKVRKAHRNNKPLLGEALMDFEQKIHRQVDVWVSFLPADSKHIVVYKYVGALGDSTIILLALTSEGPVIRIPAVSETVLINSTWEQLLTSMKISAEVSLISQMK